MPRLCCWKDAPLRKYHPGEQPPAGEIESPIFGTRALAEAREERARADDELVPRGFVALDRTRMLVDEARLFAAFLPRWLLRLLSETEGDERGETRAASSMIELRGAVLICDLSGFSKAASRLATLGDHRVVNLGKMSEQNTPDAWREANDAGEEAARLSFAEDAAGGADAAADAAAARARAGSQTPGGACRAGRRCRRKRSRRRSRAPAAAATTASRRATADADGDRGRRRRGAAAAASRRRATSKLLRRASSAATRRAAARPSRSSTRSRRPRSPPSCCASRARTRPRGTAPRS